MIRVLRSGVATVLVALELVLGACSRTPTGERARPIERRAGSVARDAAPTPPDADDCVAACVRSRQQEATGIDVIERTCAERCSLPPPTF